MILYVGTKAVCAEPMCLGDYNDFRKFPSVDATDYEKMGYKVQYADGYISWSPAEPFDAAYRSDGNFTFAQAMWLLEDGHLVTRRGWRGAGMYLFLVEADGICQQYIGMMTPEGTVVPWVCSQSCMAADDWAITVDMDR